MADDRSAEDFARATADAANRLRVNQAYERILCEYAHASSRSAAADAVTNAFADTSTSQQRQPPSPSVAARSHSHSRSPSRIVRRRITGGRRRPQSAQKADTCDKDPGSEVVLPIKDEGDPWLRILLLGADDDTDQTDANNNNPGAGPDNNDNTRPPPAVSGRIGSTRRLGCRSFA